MKSSGQKILQAIHCLINISTRYAFATTVNYIKNVKTVEERELNRKKKRVLLNNKAASLMIKYFKHMQENMQHEAAVLNCHAQFSKSPVHFRVEHLYDNADSEFMGMVHEH